ncbi:MAG: flagellar protein export ATPase FliI [Rhodobacteraceae bacterium HLUCCO18]|nr:MAG: flagellar protein export ATPase FliI [Rhodobacteraceae bacterium HLUCCO18]
MAGLEHDPFNPLRAQLRTIRATRDVGAVSALARDHVDVTGLQSVAAIGDRVRIGEATHGEILSIGAGHCRVMTEGATAGLRLGMSVVNLGAPMIAPCEEWLGRVIDPYGAAMDGRPLPLGDTPRAIWSAPPPPTMRRGLGERLATGLAVCDTLLPLVRGQRIGLFAGSGVGKSRLLATLATTVEADVIVIGLIGERGREVRDFVADTLGEAALRKCVVVAATSDRAALSRARAAATMMSVAEYFRDTGHHVLVLADSITRFAEAQSELAAAAGEPFGPSGFPASMAQMVMSLAERAGPGVEGQGDITAVFSVLVAGSDMEGPVADIMRGVLDGHIVLSREVAERGRFPAIDVLASVSRALPGAASVWERSLITRTRHLLGAYARAELMLQSGLYVAGADPTTDAAVAVWDELDAFIGMESPGSVKESFVRLAGILGEKADPAAE